MAHAARRITKVVATTLTSALLSGCSSPESADSLAGEAGQGGAPPAAGAAGTNGGQAGQGGAPPAAGAAGSNVPAAAIPLDEYGCPCTGGGSEPIRMPLDCVCDAWTCPRLCDEDFVNDFWVGSGTKSVYADCDLALVDFTFGLEPGDTWYQYAFRPSTGELVYRTTRANWNRLAQRHNYYTCGELQADTYEVGDLPALSECGEPEPFAFGHLCGDVGAAGTAGSSGAAGAGAAAGAGGASGAAGVAHVAGSSGSGSVAGAGGAE